MSLSFPEHVTAIAVDSSTTAKTIQLPHVETCAGRVVIIFDDTHSAQSHTITIQAYSGDVIHDNSSTSQTLTRNGMSIQLLAVLPNKWRVISFWNGTF
jgi:hypothetical protein